jgi:hypothetical protein
MSDLEPGLDLDGPDIDVDQAEEHGLKNTGNSCYV